MQNPYLRFSLRAILALIAVIAIALASYRMGFQAGARHAGASDLMSAKLLSLAELETIASDRSMFYQGSNRHFHYIRVDDVGYFRLRCSDVTIPRHGFDGDGSRSLGMIWKLLTMENGRLKASDGPTASSGIF